MKFLKAGFYILGETIWCVLPSNKRYFLFPRNGKMEWHQSFSSLLEFSKCKFLGSMGYEKKK